MIRLILKPSSVMYHLKRKYRCYYHLHSVYYNHFISIERELSYDEFFVYICFLTLMPRPYYYQCITLKLFITCSITVYLSYLSIHTNIQSPDTLFQINHREFTIRQTNPWWFRRSKWKKKFIHFIRTVFSIRSNHSFSLRSLRINT